MNRLQKIGKIIWPNRLRNQLVFGIVLLILVLMSVFVFFMVNRQKEFLKKQNTDHAINLVSNFSINAEQYFITNDYDGLQRLVGSHKNFPYLKYAMFLSPEGQILAHSNETNLGTRAVDSISRKILTDSITHKVVENKQFLDMAAPVRYRGQIIGWARVAIGQDYIYANLRDIYLKGIIYIVIALIAGVVFSMYIARKLSGNLYRLIGTAKKITNGDRSIRSELFRTLEVAELSKAFNQMLDEISHNERLLGLTLENMPVGVWVINDRGDIISANPEIRKIWGDIRYIGMDQFDEYRAWSMKTGLRLEARQWAGARAILHGETTANEELEIECFTGEKKIILSSAFPLYNENGVIARAIAINVDITEKRIAERNLMEINLAIRERIKELDCMYRVHEIANDPGRSMKDILQDCVDLIPGSYQYPEFTTARILFEGEEYVSPAFIETAWKQETTIHLSTGEAGSVQVFYLRKMPTESEGPFLTEERILLNSIADVLGSTAEKKRGELELRHSEEKFRSLIEQSLVGIAILQDWEFKYVNPGLEKMSGYTKAELEGGMNFNDFVHPDDLETVMNNYRLRISGQKPDDQYVFRAMDNKGHLLYVEAIVSQIMFNGEPAIIATVVDITGRVEEEKRIGRAVNDAQERERMQIGMELHDNVQQIMVGSLINIGFAKRKLDDTKEAEKMLTDISGYINDAIRELRRLSHQLSPSINKPGSFEDRIKELVKNMSVSGEIHFDIQVDKALPELNNDIQLAFYRILQEQLSNIVKYASASEVTIRLNHEAGAIKLHIRDNGKGFDTQLTAGGIGIENIRRRIHVLNGSLKIISSPGNGCELIVQVPM